MSFAKSIWRFLFPPSRMQGCTPQSKAQRLAEYEIRMGQHRADERLRAERVDQLFDQRATVQPKINPQLPAENVVQMRRRKA
jgi:hypothetical protein